MGAIEVCELYLMFGVDGDSFRAVVTRLKMTTRRHSRMGPKIAPSHPSQNIPPAIERPVRYAWPPLFKVHFSSSQSISQGGTYPFTSA